MYPSFYNINIKLEKSKDYDFIVNGHTGALDLIRKKTLQSLKEKDLRSINNDTLELLKKRGYITEKTPLEEKQYVNAIIESVHKKRADKKKSAYIFIVSNNCNFRCSYCFENQISGKGENWSKSTFTKETVDRVYEAMLEIEPQREKHSDNIYLYGGEPLLKENYGIVKYIIDEGKKRNYKFHAISNGYDLDKYINLLGPGKIESIQITMDGMEENHNKRRKHYKNNDSFSKILQNLEIAIKTNVKIVVRINGDKSNFKDIEELITLFKKRGWYDKYQFKTAPANTYRECTSLDNSSDSFTRRRFTEQIISLKETNDRISENVGDMTDISNILNKSISNDEYFSFKTSYCGAINGMRLFDPDGNIYSCWETIGHEKHRIGTYNDSLSYTDAHDKWDNRIVSKIDKCSNCKYSLICAGGCPAKLATVGKDIYQSNCEEFPKIFSKMGHYPEKFLLVFTNFLKYLFKPNATIVLLLLIAVGHYSIFVNYFQNGNISKILNNPLILLSSSIILLISAIFHEFGHVSACRYYGVKHRAIGFGLYLNFPVLYSDISDAWRIEPKKRAVIDIAGLYFQLIFNLFLFATYLLFIQNDVLLIAIKLVLIQSIIVLNPFLRFDGYWLATDLLGIANLRKRSTEFIKYLISKYILKRKPLEFKLMVNRNSKLIFILYAIISNVFMGYFIILIFSRMPDMIIEFPVFSRNAINAIINSYHLDDWKNIGLTLYRVFMKALFLFISFYFAYRISKTLFKTITISVSV